MVLNGTMTDDKTCDESKVPHSNGTESQTPSQTEPGTEPQVEQYSGPKQEDTVHYSSANDDRAYRPGNWTPSEILVLLEAKRKEQDIFSGSRRSILTADDKWKFVSDYCRTKGVQRSKEQCRFKWDNTLPDYRKIREYEEQKESGAQSYFDMESWERKAKLLASNMDLDIYQRIGSIMSNKPAKGGLSGLKREAREKKFSDSPAENAVEVRTAGANGVEAGDGTGKPWEERIAVAEYVGRHLAGAPRRRRKRRVVERVSDSVVVPDAEPESRNDSSTEDDTALPAARSEGRAPDVALMAARSEGRVPAVNSSVYLYNEKNSLTAQRIMLENRDSLAAAYRQEAAAAAVNAYRFVPNGQAQARHSSPSEARDEKAGSNQASGLRDCERSAELLTYIEDRKDARHKELVSLEREKLAVFREASFAIANAMTNAIAVFSKVAEELLRRR